MGKYDCFVCKKTANTCPSNKSGSVQCNVCDNWWHPPCVGVDAGQFELITKCIEMNMSSPWSCKSCSGVVAKLNKEVKQIASKVNANENKIATLISSEAAAKVKVDDLEKRVKELEENRSNVSNDAGEGEARVLEEIAARSSKDRNLVFHNCEEYEEVTALVEASGESVAAKEMDMNGVQGVMDILDARMKADTVLVGTRRLGRKSNGRPRPLLVIFKSKSDRDFLLSRAPRLSRESDEYWKKISIVADLTAKQRQMEKEMFKKAEDSNLNRNREEAEKNLVWKVVGRRGERLLRQYELREEETINSEGRVVRKESENRAGKRPLSPQTGHSPQRKKTGRFGSRD